MLRVYDLAIDYVSSPAVIRISGLRFGWKLDSEEENVLQTSYRIVISNEDGIAVDTGTVLSEKFIDITIPGLVLRSRTDYMIFLTVTDNHGNTVQVSQKVSTEILPDEWNADWIKPEEHIEGSAPYLRTKFKVHGVKKAIMYACGLGCAEYYINGKRTDDFLIDPPATNYEKILLYRRFDVTDLIADGGNALAVLLGDGFYSQSRVWNVEGLKYGDVCVKLRLEMTLEDGSVEVITTNTADWKYKYSPITTNNLYGGEIYDSRYETPDFADYNGSDRGWGNVMVDAAPKGVLVPCLMPPVRVIRELPAVSVHCANGKHDGIWIFDIGENIAGIGEFTLPPAPRGAVFVFRYAENLDAEGHLDIRSTGSYATQCIQQDIYISRGDGKCEVYRPRFTYHGYRYVEVSGIYDVSEGYGTMPKVSLVKGVQIATDLKQTAKIQTSHKDLNRLLNLMGNTFLSNYHGYPEDCPAREKCGWLGDAQVVCNYGLLTFDSVPSYEKYLDDIRTSCEVYGTWPLIAPGKRNGVATPLWGCAQIIIPYYMYKYCGDREAVTNNFGLMEAWVQHELDRAEDFIIREGLGDWAPPGGNENPRRMPVEHSSTLMFYEICTRMEELCREFGVGVEGYYTDLAVKVKESFVRNFYNTEKHSYGYWGTDGVALALEIYPEGEKKALLKALCEMMKREDYEMPTAIYANKYLVPMLVQEGLGSEAFSFLFNRRHPSFGTMLDDGATTVWEILDMHSIARRDEIVSSYNHPMHGGFLYFTMTDLCGINPKAPGFSQIRFAPKFVEEVEHIFAELQLTSGRVSVRYRQLMEAIFVD